MRAFFYILQKCANSTTITYPDEPLRINTKTVIPNPAKYDFMKVCYVYNIVCKIYNEFTLQQQKTYPIDSGYLCPAPVSINGSNGSKYDHIRTFPCQIHTLSPTPAMVTFSTQAVFFVP
jgi:hypothetical protein